MSSICLSLYVYTEPAILLCHPFFYVSLHVYKEPAKFWRHPFANTSVEAEYMFVYKNVVTVPLRI